MSTPDIDFVQYLVAAGFGSGVTIIIILFTIINLDHLFKAWNKLVRLLSRGGHHFRWRAFTSQIENDINTVATKYSEIIPGLFPKAVVIKPKKDFSGTIKDKDKLILRVSNENVDRNESLVFTTLQYLRDGMLAKAKQYSDSLLMQAVDYTIAERMMFDLRNNIAASFLQNNVISPALHKSDKLMSRKEIVEDLAEEEVLSRIFLWELRDLEMRLPTGARPSARTRREILELARFIRRVILGRENSLLVFEGKLIKISVPLMPTREDIKDVSLSIHTTNFRRDLKKRGISTVYLVGKREEGIRNAKRIAAWSVKEKLSKYWEAKDYILSAGPTYQIPATVVKCYARRAVIDEYFRTPREEIQFALSQTIPEILSGEVKINSLARNHGVASLICLETQSLEDWDKFVTLDENRRLKKLISLLGEPVQVIRWQPDIRRHILDTLGINPDNLRLFEIDFEKRKVKIIVSNALSRYNTVGLKFYKLNLVSEIIGFDIEITSQRKLDNDWNNDEIKYHLAPYIGAIESKEIDVIDFVHQNNFVKIALNSTTNSDPVRTCFVDGRTNVTKGFRKDTGFARVHLISHSENISEYAINALYPLKKKNAQEVAYDQTNGIINVTIQSKEARKQAKGQANKNLLLASKLVGKSINIEHEFTPT